LRGIQGILGELENAGVRPVAISADTPEESADLARKAGLTFPLLSDRKAEVIRRFDLLHPGAGVDGRDISDPAEFLVDSSGCAGEISRKLFRRNSLQQLKRWTKACRDALVQRESETATYVPSATIIAPLTRR